MAQVTPNTGMRARAIEVPKMTGTLYYIVAMVFVVFSFWNGLFFDTSFMVTDIYWSAAVITCFIWLKQNRLKVSSWHIVDYLVLAYFGVYFLSALWPANVEYGVLGFVRGIAYLLLYLVLRIVTSVSDKKQLFINCLIFSGTVFGLYGLANGFGTLNVNGAIFDPQLRRLASNFEYPNTFAIYQGIMFLFTVAMSSHVADQSKRKFLYGIAGYITLASLVLTYSRGTWLVLAGMIVLMIIIAPKENKGKIVLNTLIPVLVAVASLSLLSKATLGQKQLLGWGTIFAGLIGVAFLTWLTSTFKKFLSERQWKIGTISVGVLVLATGAIVIAKHGLPQNFVQRIASINLQQFSVVQRFLFYKDGLKVLSEHPILGAGPNAWAALWQRYQSYPYTSRQSHSFFIDLIMSVGVLGTLIFLAILVCTIWFAVRTYRKQHVRNRLISDALFVSLLGLLAHGAIDFDFSYGTINFLMWVLVSLLVPNLTIQQENILARRVEIPGLQRALTIGGITLSVAGCIIATGFLLSDHYLKKANAASKNPTVALKAAENAVALAPYRASAWLKEAQFEEMEYKQKNTDELKKKISDSAENAASLASHDPETLKQASQYIAVYGDGLQAVEIARQAWENGHYQIQYPEQYIAFTEQVGVQLFKKDKNKAKGYLTETLNTYHDVEQRIADFKNLPPVLKLEYPYEISPAMHLSAGEAAYYLGQYDEAKRVLEKVTTMQKASEQDKMKVKTILAVIQEKQGKSIDSDLIDSLTNDKQLEQYYKQLKNVSGLK